MPESKIAKFVLLPELKIKHFGTDGLWICEKESAFEVCPRCATPSKSIYDHRWVEVRDQPLRQMQVRLKILKRRFYCRACKRPFTEPVAGILPGRRTTQRFRTAVKEMCDKFRDLKSVRQEFGVSSDFIYTACYEMLELRQRMRSNASWPSRIGIDEHSYGKNSATRRTQFVSVIVDQNKGKVFELVAGKTQSELEHALGHIPGAQNVRWVSMDMCDPYRNWIQSNFPNAKIVADKFHVLRLLSPVLLKKRKEITGTRADARAKSLLLMSGKNLSYFQRRALENFLVRYPELHELYLWKEKLHCLYRTRGYHRALRAYQHLLDTMALSELPEIKTLRKTLLKWREQILNYFHMRLTNARVEGFNNKASLLKRRAYGYRSIKNYRLQLLNACS